MSELAAPAEKRPRADAVRNRERLLAAARTVFGRDGAEAQMDDVAREAGLGVGTLYRHFPTKMALMTELVSQKAELFAQHLREALDAGGDPFQALARALRRNAESLERDAATRYAMGSGTEIWVAIEERAATLDQLSRALIERGQAAGVLREDLSVNDIPMVMCGVANSIERGFDWRRHLELVLDGFRAR